MDSFTRAYLTAALFTDTPDELQQSGEFQESGEWTIANIDPDSLAGALGECEAFQNAQGELIRDALEHAGRDFWYTRNGHGCGFWDGDWPELAGDTLTTAAKGFPERHLIQGESGRLYFE